MRVTRSSLLVVLVLAAIACDRGDHVGMTDMASPVSSTASASPIPRAELNASCNGAELDALPPDTSALTPFASFDGLDLSRVGREGPYFRDFVAEYRWSVAQKGDGWRELFGEPRQPIGGPPYASLRIEKRNDAWAPVGWGPCQFEVDAKGWGNARFVVDPKAPPDPASTEISVLAVETACAGGETPKDRAVQSVIVDESERAISIVILVERMAGPATCQRNPHFPFVVQLGSPLGDRKILDGSAYPPLPRWP